MTEQFPTPSNQNRYVAGPYVEWFLNGRWVKFRILGDANINPDDDNLNLIGHVIHEDHLEELYQQGDQFFRHAGGGRGFYWAQELEVIA